MQILKLIIFHFDLQLRRVNKLFVQLTTTPVQSKYGNNWYGDRSKFKFRFTCARQSSRTPMYYYTCWLCVCQVILLFICCGYFYSFDLEIFNCEFRIVNFSSLFIIYQHLLFALCINAHFNTKQNETKQISSRRRRRRSDNSLENVQQNIIHVTCRECYLNYDDVLKTIWWRTEEVFTSSRTLFYHNNKQTTKHLCIQRVNGYKVVFINCTWIYLLFFLFNAHEK